MSTIEFRGLPPGKTKGICEISKKGYASGDKVVNIFEDCVTCGVGSCVMFEYSEEGKTIVRTFMQNDPEHQ